MLERFFGGKKEPIAPEVETPVIPTEAENKTEVDEAVEEEIKELRNIASMLRDHPSLESSGDYTPEIHFLRRYSHESQKNEDPEGKLFAKFLFDFANGKDEVAEKEMRTDIRQKIEGLKSYDKKHPIGESKGH